jgi:hypothetical protein
VYVDEKCHVWGRRDSHCGLSLAATLETGASASKGLSLAASIGLLSSRSNVNLVNFLLFFHACSPCKLQCTYLYCKWSIYASSRWGLFYSYLSQCVQCRQLYWLLAMPSCNALTTGHVSARGWHGSTRSSALHPRFVEHKLKGSRKGAKFVLRKIMCPICVLNSSSFSCYKVWPIPLGFVKYGTDLICQQHVT